MADTELDSGSIWEHARAYANLLGSVPSSFTSAVRNLKSDADQNRPLSKPTAFQSARLAGSPTLSAGLLYSAKQFYPDEMKKRPAQPSGKDFLEIFAPDALAALFGISYFYKKAKKLAAEEEWNHYSKSIHAYLDLCGSMGLNIPKIGLGKGLLVGAMDTIAITCFHLHDKKGFTEYRRTLKNKNLREDLKHEYDRWGCSRYHIASILIQALGFGVDFSNAYATGLLADETNEKYLDPLAYTFRISRVWAESLLATGKEPDRAMRVEYYPDKAGLNNIMQSISLIKSSGSQYSWLDKTKDEVVDGVPEAEGEAE